jgi:hypothetical protein
MAMAWALTKDIFRDDIVRWLFVSLTDVSILIVVDRFVAWQGLLEAGWMEYNPDVGFIIPENAMVAELKIDGLTAQVYTAFLPQDFVSFAIHSI